MKAVPIEKRVELLFEVGCEEIPAGMLPKAQEELRTNIEKLLTAALSQGYGGGNVPNSVFERFDFVNIMAYDGTGPWNPNCNKLRKTTLPMRASSRCR